MKISNSKAGKYRRCPKAYEFGYVMKLRAKQKSIYLERGSWLHTLLEVFYADDPNYVIEIDVRKGAKKTKTKRKVGTDWMKAHRLLTNEFNKLFEEEREELGDLPAECERIMRAYIERYEEDNARETTLATELDEWVELPNGDMFNFIIDRVVQKDNGDIWLRDYKTVGTFMPPDFMLIDAQLARYFWAFRRLPAFADLAPRLRGVEFDELRTKPPTVPEVVYKGSPREGLTTRANLDTDYHTYLKAIKDNGLKVRDYREILLRLKADDERFFRRTKLPKEGPLVKQMMVDLMRTAREIKSAEASGHFPRTPDKSCRFACEFMEVCIADLHGSDITNLVELKFERKESKGENE